MDFRDLDAISKTLGTTGALCLDLVSINGEYPPDGMPAGSQTRVTIRNEHISYFCTWFSLSGITSYMWYKLYILKQALR